MGVFAILLLSKISKLKTLNQTGEAWNLNKSLRVLMFQSEEFQITPSTRYSPLIVCWHPSSLPLHQGWPMKSFFVLWCVMLEVYDFFDIFICPSKYESVSNICVL